jgi:hypothetical protein
MAVNQKGWTNKEEEFLRVRYKSTKVNALSELMGRTRFSIHNKASSLGLKKNNYQRKISCQAT